MQATLPVPYLLRLTRLRSLDRLKVTLTFPAIAHHMDQAYAPPALYGGAKIRSAGLIRASFLSETPVSMGLFASSQLYFISTTVLQLFRLA